MAMGSAWEDDFGMSPIQEYRHWEDYRRLKAENAKLRELVRSVLVLRHDIVFKWLDAAIAEVFGTSFTAQARELGVEVGDGQQRDV